MIIVERLSGKKFTPKLFYLFSALTQRLRKFEKSEYTMIFGKGRRNCLTMCQLGAHISYSLRLLFHLIWIKSYKTVSK